MAGFIEFKTLRHYKDGESGTFGLTMTGPSLKEYQGPTIDDKWSLILPLLGTFWCEVEKFDPQYIDIHGLYILSLHDDDRSMSLLKQTDFSDYRNT